MVSKSQPYWNITMMPLYTTIPEPHDFFIVTSLKTNVLTNASSVLNAKKNVLREFQYPNILKRRMPG